MRLMLPGFLAVLQACTHTTSPPGFPHDWPLPQGEISHQCKPPTGLFFNHGLSNDPVEQSPPLASILFEDQLKGFPVESIRISQGEDAETLIIRGVLGGVELKRENRLPASGADCANRWAGEVDTRVVNSQLVSQAILYTGGLIIPLREKNAYSLRLAEDGALLVHLRVKATVLGALMIPIFFENENWLQYPLYQPDPVPTVLDSPGRKAKE